jgi:hypothetical protein
MPCANSRARTRRSHYPARQNFYFSLLGAAFLGGCAGTSTPSSVAYDGNSVATRTSTAGDTFAGTKSDIIRLAVRAIQAKGWKLDDVNESFGMVSFETSISWGSWSGIKANLIIVDAGHPNLFAVSGTAKQNLGNQVAAFDIAGEAQGVVREAISTMRSLQTQ